MTKHNDIVSQWNDNARAEAAAETARLQALAAETAPRRPSRLARAIGFLAVCAACFVPAAVVGWANGGFDAVEAAPFPALAAPAVPAAEAPETGVVTLDTVVIAAARPRPAPARPKARECHLQELEQGGSPDHSMVRVCL